MNNKGFTLVELLVTMIVLGVIMGITIPNITGIYNQNKMTNYYEDYKKMKTSSEYLFRGDNTVIKPQRDGDCIAISLDYIDNDEYNHAPYGGKYLKDGSFVIIKKHNKRYEYYIQLIEELPDSQGYRGFNLSNEALIDNETYFDKVEDFNGAGISSMSSYVLNPDALIGTGIDNVTHCTRYLKVYVPDES